ncbi:DCD domain-containing protein NRP-B [Nicotiana tabacum]|uniref:B2 protein n=1 Tax=Nicotiana tabacum TaxID=4097 RepID=A0A1S3XQ47_TOBAC|nr:PREDICTED: B2 protein-like [Nicotiana tabacum]
MENNQSSFYQFSDKLRLQTNNLANLSSNDSIWSNNYVPKKPEERKNFDIRVGGEVINSVISSNMPKKNLNSDYNLFSNKGVYTNPLNFCYSSSSKGSSENNNNNNNIVVNSKGVIKKSGKFGYEDESGYFMNKFGKKNNNKINRESNYKDENKNIGVEKRFKTLPASESLPRNETVGGYIFVCNNDTMHENLKRELFGLPPRYRDSVRQITPGLPLFLYNYSTHQLHGIFEAASFGGSNIDPTAWEDKKNTGESRFPAQVRVVTRKICEPLEEDSFRPILHHYDGPKFRLELNIPEAISLLDIFAEKNILNSLLN